MRAGFGMPKTPGDAAVEPQHPSFAVPVHCQPKTMHHASALATVSQAHAFKCGATWHVTIEATLAFIRSFLILACCVARSSWTLHPARTGVAVWMGMLIGLCILCCTLSRWHQVGGRAHGGMLARETAKYS